LARLANGGGDDFADYAKRIRENPPAAAGNSQPST
jgi:hypothetical protein